MAITRRDVEHVALLSRIKLTKAEIGLFVKHLSRIVDYIDRLRELDTASIEPTTHVLPIKNVFRDDKVRESLRRDDVIGNAPDSENGFVKVPRIIERA